MEIPFEKLNRETLRHLIEAYIHREGTEYGTKSWTIDEKIAQIMAQLSKGTAKITYDPETESCNILSSENFGNN